MADAALLLDAMTCNYPGDMYTQPPLPAGETFLGYAGREPGRLRIARSLTTAVDGRRGPPGLRGRLRGGQRAAGVARATRSSTSSCRSAPDAVPSFVTLWYAMATLAPVGPDQESELLPLTRYLRGKGLELKAADLMFAQAYLQAITRPALATLTNYDAILTPTLALPPVPVGYFDEVEPGRELRAAEAVHAVDGAVQHLRPAGRERAAALDRGRAAHRRHAGRPDGRRGAP